MGEEVFFDRSSGKRQVKPYQSLTENSKADTQWFDPSTGRLCAMQANPSMVPVSINHKRGFFGGVYSSASEARSRSCSSKEFENKVKSASRPCEGPNYSPTKFGRSVTGLKYCGRWVALKLNPRPILYFLLSFMTSDLNHTAMRLNVLHCKTTTVYFHFGFHPRTVLPCFDILYIWNYLTWQFPAFRRNVLNAFFTVRLSPFLFTVSKAEVYRAEANVQCMFVEFVALIGPNFPKCLA